MSEIKFVEKQYLGLNKMSLSRRITLALFCFVAYYWKENHEKSGELFFFLGIVILVISVLLVFILHFETSFCTHSLVGYLYVRYAVDKPTIMAAT